MSSGILGRGGGLNIFRIEPKRDLRGPFTVNKGPFSIQMPSLLALRAVFAHYVAPPNPKPNLKPKGSGAGSSSGSGSGPRGGFGFGFGLYF